MTRGIGRKIFCFALQYNFQARDSGGRGLLHTSNTYGNVWLVKVSFNDRSYSTEILYTHDLPAYIFLML